MELSGWIFMAISWSMIFSLAIFCFSKIFKKGLGDNKEKEEQDKDNS